MSPDIRKLRAHITQSGLSHADYARKVLLRNPATLYRWLTGRSPIPTEVRDWLNAGAPKS